MVSVHFWSVFSINVILTHTKKGQSKQVHFRELKPHLVGQTPGLEMYSFFLERSRTLHTMLQPAKASGAKKHKQNGSSVAGGWLDFPPWLGHRFLGHMNTESGKRASLALFSISHAWFGELSGGDSGSKVEGVNKVSQGGLVHITPLRNNPDTHR